MDESKPSEETPREPLTGRQVYNLVTDTVTGPNIRPKDNLYQGLAILICLGLGALIGYLAVTKEPVMGAWIGGFLGLLVGLLGSGIFLMIYRAVKHARGKHD
ncbi:MAG TPA: hypothetical protein VF789_20800 [Thermoanaerobaculia bacterium]